VGTSVSLYLVRLTLSLSRSKPEVAQAELSMSSDMSLETISSATNTEEATTAGQAVDHVTVHTPSLVTSPITPVTPPNEQLVTPIDPPHINFSRLSLSKSDNYFSNPSEIPSTNSPTASSSIDPLSIFIGGLNVQGNAAWNEEKVAEHFGNFGTIQNVRFLHPRKSFQTLSASIHLISYSRTTYRFCFCDV
jgi:hypothetical protein